MEEGHAYISKDGNGKVKLEYSKSGEQKVMLWETKDGKTLETLFDANGSILIQQMIQLTESELKARIDGALREKQIAQTHDKPYDHVKLNKPCPKCGEYNLLRYADVFASRREVPIMPLYLCNSCKTSSYHMTDTYLEYLVDNNRVLFEGAEISTFDSNKEAFMNEIKGYIIRIFASKKIMSIK